MGLLFFGMKDFQKDPFGHVVDLQNTLHSVLLQYLNGSRFRGPVSKSLLIKAGELLTMGGAADCPNTVPELIGRGYLRLEQMIDGGISNDNPVRHVGALQDFKEWEKQISESSFLRPALELGSAFRSHAHFFCYAGIHGSMSTLDYVKGFSDLDTLAIVKTSVVHDPRKIYALRKLMVRITKYMFQMSVFQHHGHLVATEVDLKFYPNVFFPTVLFAYTTRCAGNDLVVCERNDEAETVEQLRAFREQFHSGRFSRVGVDMSLFELVVMNQGILLLPALWCGLVGQAVYKRYSFDPFYEHFSEDEAEVVRRAEKVRSTVTADIPFARLLVNATSMLKRAWAYHLQSKVLTKAFCKQTASRLLGVLGVDVSRMVVSLIDRIVEDSKC